MHTDSTISIRANPPVNGWTFTVIVDSTSAFVGTRFIVSREPVWPYFQHKPFVAPFIPVPAMHRKRGKTLIYHRSVTSARTFPIFPRLHAGAASSARPATTSLSFNRFQGRLSIDSKNVDLKNRANRVALIVKDEGRLFFDSLHFFVDI